MTRARAEREGLEAIRVHTAEVSAWRDVSVAVLDEVDQRRSPGGGPNGARSGVFELFAPPALGDPVLINPMRPN
jgi:hypothetical protein